LLRKNLREMTFNAAKFPYFPQKYLELAKEEAWKETGWRWSKCDEEDLELWAHIDYEQSEDLERGLFSMWEAEVAEDEKHIKAGRPWVLRNKLVLAALWPYSWLQSDDIQKWENDEICFNRYNDLCDEMEMADDMDAFREEMEQHRLCSTRIPSSSGEEWRVSARSCGVQAGTDHEVSHTGKLSHPAMCYLVKAGPKYWSARMADGSGKIYIPLCIIPPYRWLPNTIKVMKTGKCPLFVKAVFKGFPSCRGRQLPWRAIHVE